MQWWTIALSMAENFLADTAVCGYRHFALLRDWLCGIFFWLTAVGGHFALLVVRCCAWEGGKYLR